MDIFYKIISDVSDQTPGCLGYVFLYMVVMHKNYQVPDRIGRGGNACPGRPVISKKMKHETSFLPFLWAFPEAHFYENFPKYFLNEKDKRQKTADKAAMTIKKQM